ncbi:MAG TPA: MBOAT family O-acyltransferase [Terriglobales bacterium]|nr:MBOAT family O-acyltransferase [Terriglobales bacterium]
MTFTSVVFLPFLLLTFLLWLPAGRTGRKLVLLAASLAFYAAWDPRFLALLGAVWLVVFLVPQAMARAADRARERRLLALGIATLVALLAVFKYLGFLAATAESLARLLGLSAPSAPLRVLLPVGISFYTFQAISYLVDVHRRRVPASRSPLDTALYVGFFPLVLSGPIERGAHWMPQLEAHPPFRWEQLREALERILLGVLFKVGIADPLGPLANDVFARAGSAGSGELLLGAYAYALQIFTDFAGYSLMARGIARLFGYEVIQNFEQPYFSRSFTEFWRRWHISLSSWILEYLYMPVISSVLRRLGRLKLPTVDAEMRLAYPLTTIPVMLLVGLWHGAGLHYIVWGGLHGCFLSFERLAIFGKRAVGMRWRVRNAGEALRAVLAVVLVFHLLVVTWIFFRADSTSAAWAYLSRLVSVGGWAVRGKFVLLVLLSAGLTFVLQLLERRRGDEWVFRNAPVGLRGAAYAAAIVYCVIIGGSGGRVPFIYSQF